MKYSVFTVIMQEFSLLEVVQILGEIGYDGVEWRVRDDGKHIHPKEIVERAEEVKRISEENGLEIPALATYLPLEELETIKEVFEGAKAMGAPMVRVAAPRYRRKADYNELCSLAIKKLEEIEKLAKSAGVKTLLEIHMGNIMPSASAAYRIVRNFDPERLGVIFDPGNMMREGYEDWRLGMELLGPYLAHIHLKNTKWEESERRDDGTVVWKPTWCALREGLVDWADVMAQIKFCGYKGYISSENFAQVLPTREKLADDLNYLRSLEG